jgi:hypothetical protein
VNFWGAEWPKGKNIVTVEDRGLGTWFKTHGLPLSCTMFTFNLTPRSGDAIRKLVWNIAAVTLTRKLLICCSPAPHFVGIVFMEVISELNRAYNFQCICAQLIQPPDSIQTASKQFPDNPKKPPNSPISPTPQTAPISPKQPHTGPKSNFQISPKCYTSWGYVHITTSITSYRNKPLDSIKESLNSLKTAPSGSSLKRISFSGSHQEPK